MRGGNVDRKVYARGNREGETKAVFCGVKCNVHEKIAQPREIAPIELGKIGIRFQKPPVINMEEDKRQLGYEGR